MELHQSLVLLRDYVSWSNESQNEHIRRNETSFSPRTSECYDNSQTCEQVEAVQNTPCAARDYATAPPVGVGKLLALLGFNGDDKMEALPPDYRSPAAQLDLVTLEVLRSKQAAKSYPAWYTQPPTKRAIVMLKEFRVSSLNQRSKVARAFCILEFVDTEQVINILFLSGIHGGAEALLAYLTNPTVGALSGTPQFTTLVAKSNTNMLYAKSGEGAAVCDPLQDEAAAFSENTLYRDHGFKNASACPASAHKQYSQEESQMVFCV